MISWMQTHRKYLVVTIWISTIAFVGAGFVGWGAYSFTADKTSVVAKVGDRSISGEELQSSYNNIYSYYNQLLGGKLTQEKADELNLQDIALDQLIKQTLLLNYADELGLEALDSEVVAQIQSIENFYKDGSFDKDTYFKVLKAVNKKVKVFEEDIKKEIIIQKLTKALSMPYTELELKTLGASLYLQDQISAKLIDVQNSDIDISEEAVKEYWENNKIAYMSDKSYTIELIKVSSSGIEVSEDEIEEFYNSKRHLFKDADDKILALSDAKDRVKEKLQLKKAKKEVLKKYLAFKSGKITADETKTLTEKNSDIPLDKIQKAKVGSYIKAIELKDGYITAKLTSINMPEPLKFEDAKASAQNDMIKSKKTELLTEKAIKEASDLKGAKNIGFLGKEDADKITMLSENEARAFLDKLFVSNQKKGYYIFDDKAIVYEITDQKLITPEQLNENREDLVKNIESIKNNTIQNMLIQQLENRYKVEK